MACAVAGLVEVLEQDQHHLNLDTKPQIEYFLKKARSFRDFLVNLSLLIPENLVTRIIDAAHKAEDVIEVHLTNKMVSLSQVDLKELEEEFESIKLEIDNESEAESHLPVDNSSPSLPYNYLSRNNDVILYEDDFQTLKGQIIHGPSQLQTISIYGMPGMGKRTLARRLYTDSFIASHFNTRAWVNASIETELRGLLLRLLDALGKLTNEMQSQNDSQLGVHLRNALKNKRYFIALHEVWVWETWDSLTRLFPDDGLGSRILFTAWDWNKKKCFAKSGTHMLRFLYDDESWLLFCQKVFGQEHCPDELEPIGKRIIGKCKGITQVVSIIAGLLATSEKTPTLWRLVDASLHSTLESTEDHYITQEIVIQLIYDHLPYWLKPCLLYVVAFEECCDIQASKIIKLWIAEGFVKQSANNSLENIAEAYLNILIDKNLLLLTQEEPDGRVKTFQILPFLRMYFMSQAQSEKFLLYKGFFTNDVPEEEEDENVSQEYEDVSVEDEDVSQEDEDVSQEDEETMRRVSHHPLLKPSQETKLPSHVRSFLSIGHASLHLARVFLGSIFLRVLDVFQLEFYQFPIEILQLVLLRYLAFSCHSRLPKGIYDLRNLQSLIIRRLPSFRAFSLPADLWEMAQLRHVKCKETFILYYPENGKNVVHWKLQTLSNMYLFGVTNEFLHKIPNIIKLGITCNIAMHTVLDLACLEKLETLKCSSDWSLASHNFLSYLTFPPSFRKLTLSLCKIPPGFMKVFGSLPNLQELKLQKSDFLGIDSGRTDCEWETAEGEFPQLLSLAMLDLNLVHWRAHATHFPRLRQLIIHNCYAMVEIPLDIGDLPALEKIQVDNGGLASAKKIKKKQEIRGNKLLQVVNGN